MELIVDTVLGWLYTTTNSQRELKYENEKKHPVWLTQSVNSYSFYFCVEHNIEQLYIKEISWFLFDLFLKIGIGLVVAEVGYSIENIYPSTWP